MFDLHFSADGKRVLKQTDRFRYPGERGVWVQICHHDDKERDHLLQVNKSSEMQIEIDDKGFYRGLVLKD